MTKIEVTAIIIAKNEAAMIAQCCQTLGWCKEILVIDDGSTDETAHIAEKEGARVVAFKHSSFATLRNEALKYTKTDWVFYIDADERVTPTLSKEILVTIEAMQPAAISMQRQNIFFGREFTHGGWESDVVTRIFKRDAISKWVGDIHESPEFQGTSTTLKTKLLHLTHRDVVSGLQKTTEWTPMEAKLLFQAGIPPVTIWTVLRKGVMEVVRRVMIKRGYQDGEAGVMEGFIQGINRMLVYIQVWELQQKPVIPEAYKKIEKNIQTLWEKEL